MQIYNKISRIRHCTFHRTQTVELPATYFTGEYCTRRDVYLKSIIYVLTLQTHHCNSSNCEKITTLLDYKKAYAEYKKRHTMPILNTHFIQDLSDLVYSYV